MRRIIAAFLAALALSATVPARAGDNLVVVELFSSQGCAACPPADELLNLLAERDDVLPLALHVDYWDYIGWKDIFAHPRNTERQKAYARMAGHRMIYTPQMIVGGKAEIVGYKPMMLAEQILEQREEDPPVKLQLVRSGGRVHVTGTSDRVFDPPAWVQLVRYIPRQEVKITRGENAGKTILYSNIVTDWKTLQEWDGREPLSLIAEAKGDQPVAVIVQEAGPGPVLGAARLR